MKKTIKIITPIITTTTETIPEKLIAKYIYDVLGRRISKETENSVIKYIYSGEKVLVEKELINGVAKTKEYVYGDKGIDDVIAVIIDGTTYYYHKDHLGSIVGITNSNGNLVSSYEYDSYGNFVLSGSDIGNDRLFTGREYDRETVLYYYRARYYSSELGRFISRDPIDIEDNINLYTYVGNNPVMFSDPSGLKAKSMLKGAIEGDYNSDWNGLSSVGQILRGFIPVYGQAADVRDFSHAWNHGTNTDIAFSLMGFVPGVGDGAKALRKVKWSNISKPDTSIIANEKLKSIINRNYREGAKIGNGSTADAIRNELLTGELTGGKNHLQKGKDTITGLDKLLKSGNLDDFERKIANNIINDIKDAFNTIK